MRQEKTAAVRRRVNQNFWQAAAIDRSRPGIRPAPRYECLESRHLLSVAPVAVDDAYTTNADTILSVTDPVAVPPGGSFPGLAERHDFALGYGVSQIEYSAAYNLVFVRQGSSTIHVLDGRTGAELGTHSAINSFTDFSVSPDGRYLYVADYGGTNIGYGTPSTPSYIHRYDAVSNTWQSESVTGIAYQVEAVDDSRFLLKGIDQWVNITLNAFNDSPTTSAPQLATISADFEGDFEYDPATGRILMGNSGISSPEIHVYQVVGNTLVGKEATATYGSAELGGGSSVLSTDGKYFFYGPLQVDAAAVATNIRTLPEIIRAAGSGLAFGSAGYYSEQTGVKLGSLPFATTIYDASPTSNEVWAYDPTSLSLHDYGRNRHGALMRLVHIAQLVLSEYGVPQRRASRR